MTETRVFVSYSHADMKWVEPGHHGLVPWLAKDLSRDGIRFWYDPELRRHPGQWISKIKEEIDKAQFALLLVSQDFAMSDFIRDHELPWIRERAERKELSILPILVGPVSRHDATLEWITRWQFLHSPPKPLVDYLADEAAYQQVRVEILDSIRDRVRVPPDPALGGASAGTSDKKADCFALGYSFVGAAATVSEPSLSAQLQACQRALDQASRQLGMRIPSLAGLGSSLDDIFGSAAIRELRDQLRMKCGETGSAAFEVGIWLALSPMCDLDSGKRAIANAKRAARKTGLPAASLQLRLDRLSAAPSRASLGEQVPTVIQEMLEDFESVGV